MSERVTSRRYESPHRPAPIVAVERWLRRVRGEPAPFDARELVKTAMAKAGSSSFEEEDALMEPLERLCEALDREARLTWTGRVLTRARLMGALTSRLRLRALFDANPAMAGLASKSARSRSRLVSAPIRRARVSTLPVQVSRASRSSASQSRSRGSIRASSSSKEDEPALAIAVFTSSRASKGAGSPRTRRSHRSTATIGAGR